MTKALIRHAAVLVSVAYMGAGNLGCSIDSMGTGLFDQGSGGTGDVGGNSGSSGTSGISGQSGSAGSGGNAGSAGSSGDAGNSGNGSSGSAGNSGQGGDSGSGGDAGIGGSTSGSAGDGGSEAGSGGDSGTSSGNGGQGGDTAGAGGEGGNSGNSGSGGEAGNAGVGGSEAGAGGNSGSSSGNGGQGGDAGVGGNAGSSSGSGGEGGSGGQGGVSTCIAGDSGVPDSVKAKNSSLLGLMVDYYPSGVDFHSSTGSPILATFAGQMMPGQAVLTGYNGLGFELKSAGAATARPWFTIDLNSLSTYAECTGGGERSAACMTKVVKSYRCQKAPYLESDNCPTPQVSFSAQPAAATYSGSTVGWEVVLVDLTCP